MKNIFNLSIAEANIAGMIELYDTVTCDQNLGRPLPSGFTEQEYQRLKYIENYLLVLLYDGKLAKTFSAPILKAVIEAMELVIAKKNGEKRLTVISAHDTDLAPILTTLNITSAECVQRLYRNQSWAGNCAEPVPFASSIQFELHLDDSTHYSNSKDPQDYFVRVKYNGDYYQLCQSKTTQCVFPDFASRVRHSILDFDKECRVK
jgi:hypothetical protein